MQISINKDRCFIVCFEDLEDIFIAILGCPAGTGCKWIVSPLHK